MNAPESKTAEHVEALGGALFALGMTALGGALGGALLAAAFGLMTLGALLVVVANA